jgi:hypothetical protein
VSCFYCIINKYIEWKFMYTVYTIYTKYVLYCPFMSTSGTAIQYRRSGCQSPSPYKIYCLNVNFVFNLCDVLQQCTCCKIKPDYITSPLPPTTAPAITTTATLLLLQINYDIHTNTRAHIITHTNAHNHTHKTNTM